MKELKDCVRCGSCSLDNERLSCSEIAEIYVKHRRGTEEISIEKCVCRVCRSLIGDDASDNLLKERSNDEA